MRRYLFVCLALVSAPVGADSSDPDAPDTPAWSLLVGGSLKFLSLDVYRKGEKEAAGSLVGDPRIFPELSLERGFRPLTGSFGYSVAFNLGPFRMDTQAVGSDADEQDLGTSAKGFYVYAMPELAYEIYATPGGSSFMVGAGLGLGYLNARGSVKLTEDGSNELHRLDLSGLTYSYGMSAEMVSSDWSFSLTGYGPVLARNGFRYELFELGLSIRRSFAL